MTTSDRERIPQERLGKDLPKENSDQSLKGSETQNSKEEASSNIALAETPIVIPPLTTAELLDHFNRIQTLKRSLISPNDTVKIAGRDYILKSGWRKLAFAFNLTDEILREEKETLPNGNIVWHMWIKVTAPNGRSVIGVAACSSEEREFTHGEHDPYALCHTRAKNRAISDILGLGEVSAEEMTGVKEKAEAKPVEVTKPSERVLVRFLQDIPVIAGVDLKEYGPFKKEDIANLLKDNADSLVKSGLAQRIPSPVTPEPSVFEIKSKTGALLAIAEVTPESIAIEPSVEVRADLPLFKSFLIPRVLASFCEKHGGSYRVEADNEGYLTQISLTGSKLDETRIKELLNAIRWTLERASEKT